MKKLIILVVAVAGFATVAVAGNMTWSKPLPSAADATLGAGQQLEKQKAAIEEMRTRISSMGVFAGYTTQGN